MSTTNYTDLSHRLTRAAAAIRLAPECAYSPDSEDEVRRSRLDWAAGVLAGAGENAWKDAEIQSAVDLAKSLPPC